MLSFFSSQLVWGTALGGTKVCNGAAWGGPSGGCQAMTLVVKPHAGQWTAVQDIPGVVERRLLRGTGEHGKGLCSVAVGPGLC